MAVEIQLPEGLWCNDLVPRWHMTAESINENAILQWMKPSVLLLMRLASLQKVTVAEGPQPPLMKKDRGGGGG